jgi:hypothetical protein
MIAKVGSEILTAAVAEALGRTVGLNGACVIQR